MPDAVTGQSQQLDAAAVNSVMTDRGFAELEACWRSFCAQGQDLRTLDEADVERRRAAHTDPLFGHPIVAGLGSLGAALGVRSMMGTASDEITRPLPPAVRPVADAAFTLNIAVLGVAATLAVQRYLLHPFTRLMGLEAASMLRWANFREHFAAGERALEATAKFKSLGVTDCWDNPAYSKDYRISAGKVQELPQESAENLILGTFRDLLGQKDEASRKHAPGRFTPALVQGKRSVTEIIARFADEIAQAKSGQLPREKAADCLAILCQDYIKPEFDAARIVRTRAETIRQTAAPLPDQAVRAAVWARDPWADLTSQKEFFSSASLRGNSIFESGSKGRLGNFGYLHNPAICCLDFSTHKGRAVRVRMLAATVSSDGESKAVLFVDGVEGTNSISPVLIRTAVESYARECGFHAVLYNTSVHNSTPKAFIRSIASTSPAPREFFIEAIDATTREYLDAFGFPIQPMEYQFPRGHVRAHAIALNLEGESLGKSESWIGNTKRFLQRNLLYIFYADAVGFATLATMQVSGYLAAGMGALGAAGLFANHWYQGRAARALRDKRQTPSNP